MNNILRLFNIEHSIWYTLGPPKSGHRPYAIKSIFSYIYLTVISSGNDSGLKGIPPGGHSFSHDTVANNSIHFHHFKRFLYRISQPTSASGYE